MLHLETHTVLFQLTSAFFFFQSQCWKYGNGKKKSWFWEESDIWFEELKSLDQQRGGWVYWSHFYLWYQWGTSTTVSSTIQSCGVSKRNIPIFPHPNNLFHPLCTPLLPCAGTSVCMATQWTLLGNWSRPKLFSFVCFLASSSSNLSQPTRDERSAELDLIATYSIHQIIIQAALYRQDRENGILVTAMKISRQASVPCYTATKYCCDQWWEKILVFPNPNKEEVHGAANCGWCLAGRDRRDTKPARP